MGVELKLFSGKDIDTVFEIQRASYKPLYEKYQDTVTNPYLESRETVLRKYSREGTQGYLILEDGAPVGAVRISITGRNDCGRISALCVLPRHQGRGTAQKALTELERLHPGIRNWSLDTILEEAGCCHLYEKLGYKQTGKTERINEKMTLVFYEKDLTNSDSEGSEGPEIPEA